jgi:hypothetical protein
MSTESAGGGDAMGMMLAVWRREMNRKVG